MWVRVSRSEMQWSAEQLSVHVASRCSPWRGQCGQLFTAAGSFSPKPWLAVRDNAENVVNIFLWIFGLPCSMLDNYIFENWYFLYIFFSQPSLMHSWVSRIGCCKRLRRGFESPVCFFWLTSSFGTGMAELPNYNEDAPLPMSDASSQIRQGVQDDDRGDLVLSFSRKYDNF